MNVTVIDALMGQGKTTYVFDMIRDNPNERYIYIGVDILQGEERPKAECPSLHFRNPIPRHGVKYWDLYSLVHDGANIGSTHQLFRRMTAPLYEKLKGKDYTLIIDEALDVVEQYKITPVDLEWLLNEEAVYVDDRQRLRWNHQKYPKYEGKWQELVPLCDNGNLVNTRQGILIWQFPASFLDAFKRVYICTYMFEGQVMADYFKAEGADYRLTTLANGELVDYGLVDNSDQKAELAGLINLDMDQNRNEIGVQSDKGFPLSRNWFKNRLDKRASSSVKAEVNKLRNGTMAFFKEYGEGAANHMWTTFTEYRKHLKGPRYARYDQCFVPMNAKATNRWADKQGLAYLVDCHQSPIVAGYFQDRDIATRPDLFALTELIQWVWRSRIRKSPPEPIQLYLPSERMRTILTNWIRHSDAEIVAGQRLEQEG